MADWITKKKKEQRRGTQGPKGKKPAKQKFYVQIKEPNDTQIVLPTHEFDYKEDKKPHSTGEGQKASLERSFKRVKPVLQFKGGGIAQRGLGRAFNKGGKV